MIRRVQLTVWFTADVYIPSNVDADQVIKNLYLRQEGGALDVYSPDTGAANPVLNFGTVDVQLEDEENT